MHLRIFVWLLSGPYYIHLFVYIWFIVLLIFFVSFLLFFMVVLAIVKSGMLTSAVSHFSFVVLTSYVLLYVVKYIYVYNHLYLLDPFKTA